VNPNVRQMRSSPTPDRALEEWLALNARFAVVWPNISDKKEALSDAEDFEGVEGKFEKFFSEAAGSQ
jgi:ferredoxin